MTMEDSNKTTFTLTRRHILIVPFHLGAIFFQTTKVLIKKAGVHYILWQKMLHNGYWGLMDDASVNKASTD